MAMAHKRAPPSEPRSSDGYARFRTGYVRTYGDISPGGAAVGWACAEPPPMRTTHRGTASCGADGSLAKGDRQRRLLESEGVAFRGRRVLLSEARLDDLDAL